MTRVLLVSIAFPPKSDPEALQTAKYFHQLCQLGDIEIDVVTSKLPTLNMPRDELLAPYAKGVKQLIQIPLRENKYVNYIRARLGLSSVVFPDSKQSFHKQHLKVISQLNDRPDLIYSRSDPKSSTIMAFRLQEALGVPWILHMSDPWADCPIQKMSGHQYDLHNKWEAKCFAAATLISLTSQPTIEFYQKKYPEFSGKFRFFPNVFDEGLGKRDANIKPSNKLRIISTGGLAGLRSPEFLLKPLLHLYQDSPAIAERIEVVFAGDADSVNRAIFARYSLPFVQWIGRISYQEALQLQRSANYLVAIDTPIADPDMAMFFPSKLLDYMVARKRILVITNSGSVSERVVQDLNGDVCGHGQVEMIKSSIVKALVAFEKGDQHYLSNKPPLKLYDASFNAIRLRDEIKGLLKESLQNPVVQDCGMIKSRHETDYLCR